MEAIEISVVMGVYNERNRNRLMESVRSVLDQDMDGIEVLLCDDGSDEAAAALLKEAAAMDPRIRLLRQEHAGLGAALNLGIRNARGKYIARMDADDFSRRDRFAKQEAFLENNRQYDWVGSWAAVFDETGVWGHRKMPLTPVSQDFYRYSPYIHPSVMFRRSLFESCGYYDTGEAALRCEDYELFMRFHSKGRRGCNLNEELLYYREDKESYEKRKYHYRIRECFVRKRGFRVLEIDRGIGWYYVFRPLLAGLCPSGFLRKLRGIQGNAAGGFE